MAFPVLTATYGSLLAILFVPLSVWVSAGRARYKAHHGDGGSVQLQRQIRSQANFAEYVPKLVSQFEFLAWRQADSGTKFFAHYL